MRQEREHTLPPLFLSAHTHFSGMSSTRTHTHSRLLEPPAACWLTQGLGGGPYFRWGEEYMLQSHLPELTQEKQPWNRSSFPSKLKTPEPPRVSSLFIVAHSTVTLKLGPETLQNLISSLKSHQGIELLETEIKVLEVLFLLEPKADCHRPNVPLNDSETWSQSGFSLPPVHYF